MGETQYPPLVNLDDAELRAERVLPRPTFEFIAAGAGDELTRNRNRDAFRRRCLLPQVLRDVSQVDLAATVLGEEISLPVLVAPMGLQRIVDPEGECEMARGVAAAETIMCVSTVSTRSAAEIAATGVRRWYQLYLLADRAVTADLVAQAREHGYRALVVTVDGPVLARRDRAIRAGFSFGPEIRIPSCGPALGRPEGLDPVEVAGMLDRSATWETVEWLAESGLPVVVKGVLTAADAARACEHGAAAVIVSNHGGRQLDGVPATLDVLAAVVEAVDGRAEVLLDGGIRRGTDVLIALALGAQAVLIGRPAYWGLAVGGAAGVTEVIELLRAEVRQALTLVGCRGWGELTAEHVADAPA
ncbi:MAG: alpha-hydroxy-acid oxidizing protein [Actinobacteria bacterium]|nr:alpha-hydroxy-acid oxidizing protein [Actinomycetota bacterium]